LTNLEEAREDVELKHRDVVVAREVDGGFEGHGFQPRADKMHFVKTLAEHLPRHYRPARRRKRRRRRGEERRHSQKMLAVMNLKKFIKSQK